MICGVPEYLLYESLLYASRTSSVVVILRFFTTFSPHMCFQRPCSISILSETKRPRISQVGLACCACRDLEPVLAENASCMIPLCVPRSIDHIFTCAFVHEPVLSSCTTKLDQKGELNHSLLPLLAHSPCGAMGCVVKQSKGCLIDRDVLTRIRIVQVCSCFCGSVTI